jgi:hypothetical protein
VAVPITIDDGNYKKIAQVGCDEWSLPFSDRGDQKSFELVRTYRVGQGYWKPEKAGYKLKSERGICYLVTETDPRNIGNGILEWQRIFASVPETRQEGGSIVYSAQILSTQVSYDFETPPSAPEVTEVPLTMACRVQWEYFLDLPPPLLKPQVLVVYGSVIKIGGWGQSVFGREYPAEDSEVGIYKGRIYYRRTPFIRWPLTG